MSQQVLATVKGYNRWLLAGLSKTEILPGRTDEKPGDQVATAVSATEGLLC